MSATLFRRRSLALSQSSVCHRPYSLVSSRPAIQRVGKPDPRIGRCASRASALWTNRSTVDLRRLQSHVSRPHEPSVPVSLRPSQARATRHQYRMTLPTDPVAAPKQNGREHLELPAPPGVLARDDHVRRPGAPTPGRLHAEQRQEHLHEHEPELGELHRASRRAGVHGDAVLSAGLGARSAAPMPTAAATASGARREDRQRPVNMNTGQQNNAACNNLVGTEPVNYAIVTKSGVPWRPPGPTRDSATRPW